MRSTKRSAPRTKAIVIAPPAPIIINATQHPGYAHFEAMKPRFMAIKQTRRIVNVDLSRSGRLLIKASKTWKKLGLAEVLEGLPKHLYDIERVEDLLSYGWSLRYIGTMRRSELALETNAAIPAELVAAAEDKKERLLKTATHFFGAHPVHGKEIASIRRGRGYEDLVEDLIRLVVLHTKEVGILSTDPIHYRAEDVVEAQALHLKLSDALDEFEGTPWGAVALKAFTFIEKEYRDLRLTVAWAWRDEPEVLKAFPTLFTKTSRGGGEEEEDVEEEPEDEEEDNEAEPTDPE